MTGLLAVAPYAAAVLLVGTGAFVLLDDDNLVKKVVGLNLFQTGIFLFLVAAAVRAGGRSPLVGGAGAETGAGAARAGAGPEAYVNPLPHVLVLTAIVVGVSVTAVALALVVRVQAAYGTVEESRLPEASDE